MLGVLLRFVGMRLLLLLEVAAALVRPGRLVLLRHGESLWNKENRFTGWEDVPLTAAGEEEAREAANMLVTEEEDTRIDVVYTSVLCRAIRTSELFVQEYANAHAEATPPPICTRWRLNERHYGVLQGLDKAETLAAWEDRAALKDWRLSFAGKPPPMEPDHPYYSRAPARLERLRDANMYGRTAEYADGGEALVESDVPLTESIADTVVRVRPFWVDELLPSILAGQTALVVGHANCLRALVSCIQSNIDVSATRTMNTYQLSPCAMLVRTDRMCVRYLCDASGRLARIPWAAKRPAARVRVCSGRLATRGGRWVLLCPATPGTLPRRRMRGL